MGDGDRSDTAFGNLDEAEADAEAAAGTDTDDEPKSWWQKLKRKRVLYPVAIGVAAFGIGLGGVVIAEN
ncbi:hypothetical protein KCW65_26125, partial [Mycobacterium tuberculosis]|nr:hypothetical protein [Mycobacterium tuberculosis]